MIATISSWLGRMAARAGVALVLACAGGAAWAQDYSDASGKPVTALLDLRLTGADGERSWLDGRFGKARFGGDAASGGDGLRVRGRAVEADLVWQPQLSWSLGGTFAVTAQQGQEHPVDLSEAFLSWRRDPHGATRVSGRLGLFWPPVSLEHSGPAWTVTETITPSAINSWIGEEVKGAGAEATLSFALGQGHLAATAALFGFNDTAGTLLAFRGWALHDEKATAFGHQPLPALGPFMEYVQAQRSRPAIELDHRPGFYARLAWSSAGPLKLQAFYYDNRGNPEAVDADMQWGWRTRFGNIGAILQIGPQTKLTSQAMIGSTQMGFPEGGRVWVDTRFRSAFLLATRVIGGASSVSGRIEGFGTTGRGSILGAEDSENGWAATLAGRHMIGRHVAVLGEILHIESTREARVRDAEAPHQTQTVVQLAARLTL
jgi:hypothetical protein